MNEIGVYVAVAHPNEHFYNVSDHVPRKDNWSLGLFFDTTCQTREINEKIIAQVRSQNFDRSHMELLECIVKIN